MSSGTRRHLFWAAGALFALAAVRDAFAPHFFSHGDGSPAVNIALAAVFIILGARVASSERVEGR